MDSDLLRKEFEFYLKNQEEFVEKYEGRFIVLKTKQVIGVYDSKIEAYEETKKDNELGTFLIQFVGKDKESYSQTFYSRVSV